DDVRRVALPSNSRSVTVYPPICLEAGKTYKVRLTFRRSNYDRDTPSASVLIDSVSFVVFLLNVLHPSFFVIGGTVTSHRDHSLVPPARPRRGPPARVRAQPLHLVLHVPNPHRSSPRGL